MSNSIVFSVLHGIKWILVGVFSSLIFRAKHPYVDNVFEMESKYTTIPIAEMPSSDKKKLASNPFSTFQSPLNQTTN